MNLEPSAVDKQAIPVQRDTGMQIVEKVVWILIDLFKEIFNLLQICILPSLSHTYERCP